VGGAFYLFPDLSAHAERLRARGVVDSITLCDRLLEDAGVATLPGVAFGRPRDELTLRLAYVNFDGAAALAAVGSGETVDVAFTRRHCAETIEAVARLAQWCAH
jgi:aspartate aminotransferase